MTYDLRRLRLHGLIERIPHAHRYELSDADLPTVMLLTRDGARRRESRTRPGRRAGGIGRLRRARNT